MQFHLTWHQSRKMQGLLPTPTCYSRPIHAGGAHACGVDALQAAYCWGDGADGQLGTGRQDNVGVLEGYSSNTPIPIAQEGGSTIPFYSVSAGGRHTCGVSLRAAPAASPAPAPSLGAEGTSAPAPPPPASSSSSFPVGAVVGAVVGAAGELGASLACHI